MKLPWKKLRPRVSLAAAVLGVAVLLGAVARADRPYAPSRDYHLQNVRVSLRFDLDQRKVIGEVTHTFSTIARRPDASGFRLRGSHDFERARQRQGRRV